MTVLALCVDEQFYGTEKTLMLTVFLVYNGMFALCNEFLMSARRAVNIDEHHTHKQVAV